MNFARALVLCLALSMVAACGSRTAGSAAAGDFRVFLVRGDGTQSVDVLSTDTGAVINFPAGVLSPDGARFYATGVDRQGTAWQRVYDTLSGNKVAEKPLSGYGFDSLGIISGNGRWLARSYLDSTESTRISVVETTTLAEHAINLRGRFTLDAISNSGALLYLLEAVGQDTYRVRDYDLVHNTLDATVIVDKTDASPVMSGTRVMSVAARQDERVFTLYKRTGKAPFIHILDVQNKQAFCVDLPAGPAPKAGAPGWSLLVDEERGILYAVNAGGMIASIDYPSYPQLRTTSIFTPPATAAWRFPFGADAMAKSWEDSSAVVSRPAISKDGRTLFVPDDAGFMTIAAGNLRPTGRQQAAYKLTGLLMAPAGTRLFAVQPSSNQVFVMNATGAQVLKKFTTPYPATILRVEAI